MSPDGSVRAAGAQLVLAFIQHLDENAHTQLAEAMPMVTTVLQGLAGGSTETGLALCPHTTHFILLAWQRKEELRWI